VQFSQWAAALKGLEGEYGYYPPFDTTALVMRRDHEPGRRSSFHDILVERNATARPLLATGPGGRSIGNSSASILQ